MPDKVLMKGNEAIAEAAVAAGCRHYFGYPITPQNEIGAYMSKRLPQIGGVFLQAESEIAAINMVLGASAAGKRAMTTSSSPGVALKGEGLSYMAGCDLPAVVANVQRGGPGLGSIQPSQADYFLATRSAGHGDFRMITLAPGGVQEMFDLTYEAFWLADRYRVACMILTDGVLGQMMEPVAFYAKPERELPAKDWAVTGTGGKRGNNVVNSLFMEPEELERVNLERYARYGQIEEDEPRHEQYMTEGAEIIVTAYGAASRAAKNAVDALRGEGAKVGLIRPVTLWPFPKKAFLNLAKSAKAFLTVEMSMGQMIDDVRLSIECLRPVTLCSRVGGVVLQPGDIIEKVRELL
ncbi:MAG: 3-methyl-2-oxobutanoate dehydrogenase subunit VorB [Defluviitaleaceae bacterium]|nr:3-methyl-2-oxobutanoate dehydrogenase subunit VorB [Defluviitaleaceae bacterium]